MQPLTIADLGPTKDPSEVESAAVRPWVVLLRLGPIMFLIPCEWPKLHTNEPTKERTTNA